MLNAAYEPIVSELLRAEVRFLVSGGYAMAALGLPRFTNDLDLWLHSEMAHVRARCGASGPVTLPRCAAGSARGKSWRVH